MSDPMSLVRLNDEVIDDVRLQGLGMVVALTGHADAGQAVAQTAAELLATLEHKTVASFDADLLLDYRSRRPSISFRGDRFADYRPPRIELHRLTDGLGQDFLLLTGPEPDFLWERFSAAVVRLAAALNVRLAVSVAGVPLPVPHTRRFGVTAHGNRPDLIEGISTWEPTADLPAGLAQVIELRLAEAGRDAVGYSLHVPHYLADAEYPQAAVAALEFIGAALGLGLPTDRLREQAREVEGQIAEQVAQSPDIQRMVTGFERRFDEQVPESSRRSLLVAPGDELPDGEDLASAAEAFLSSRAGEPGQDEGR